MSVTVREFLSMLPENKRVEIILRGNKFIWLLKSE